MAKFNKSNSMTRKLKFTLVLFCCFFFLNQGATAVVKQGSSISCQRDTLKQATLDVEYKTGFDNTINWESELKQTRVIPTMDGKGIRITLPNSDSAKIIILDRLGSKKLKKIMYVSPAVIDISDLRKGQYQLIIEIHKVIAVKTFQKKR